MHLMTFQRLTRQTRLRSRQALALAVLTPLIALTACTTTPQTTQQSTPASPSPIAEAGDFSRGLVGKEAPGFTLNNADGKPVDITTVLGTKPVVLVIYRGNW